MKQEEKRCIKELNDWYFNKDWPNKINQLTNKPFGKYGNKIHCFDGIMLNAIGIEYKKIVPKKYDKYILEIMITYLNKYDIKLVSIGYIIFSKVGGIWIETGELENEKNLFVN